MVNLTVVLVVKLVQTVEQEETQVNQAVVVAGVLLVVKATEVLLHLCSVRAAMQEQP